MKFFQLFRKEIELLLNKILKSRISLPSLPKPKYRLKQAWTNRRSSIFFILIFVLISAIPSCSDKKKEVKKPLFSFNDSSVVNKEIKKILGDNLKFVLTGNFDTDSLQEIAAGIDLTENNNWGIKFVLLELVDNQLKKTYESELLDGSFKDCLVKKIKFPKMNYDLIYYNSQDYFWGSGGGEVFAYLINFEENEIYYSHLFSESRKPAELFLSKNTTEPELRKFFISSFRNDYPDLKLASEDVSLEF